MDAFLDPTTRQEVRFHQNIHAPSCRNIQTTSHTGVLAGNRRNFRTIFAHNRSFRITQENIIYY